MGDEEFLKADGVVKDGDIGGLPLSDRIRINIWVKRSLWEGVVDVSNQEDMSVSDVVRHSLREYVRKYKAKG